MLQFEYVKCVQFGLNQIPPLTDLQHKNQAKISCDKHRECVVTYDYACLCMLDGLFSSPAGYHFSCDPATRSDPCKYKRGKYISLHIVWHLTIS